MDNAKSTQSIRTYHPAAFWCALSLASFIVGFVAALAIVRTNDGQARNASKSNVVPAELQDFAPEWMQSVDAETVGPLTVVTGGKKYGCNAIIYPHASHHYPSVFYVDEDADGVPDSVSVYGLRGEHFMMEDLDGDGTLDSCVYVTESGIEATHFMDGNLDGQYEQRFGPGKRFSVLMDAQWRDVTTKDGKSRVQIGEQWREIEQADGVWVARETE